MNVSDFDKIALATELLPMIIEHLAKRAAPNEVTADDIVDFLAIGVAAVIDNDSKLDTPQLRRKAAEGVSRRVVGQIKALGEYRAIHGQSFLSALLQGARVDWSLLEDGTAH